MKNFTKKNRGFTLVELLIAISIFMVLLTVSANSFLSIIRTQSSANEIRQTYSDLRAFIDLINNEMRGGSIDYFCYGSTFDILSTAQVRCQDTALGFDSKNALRVISADGLSASVIYAQKDITDQSRLHVFLRRWRNNDGAWEPEAGFSAADGGAQEILFNNVQVKKLNFDILPKVLPSAAKNLADEIQPIVEVNLEVEGTNNFKMDFQTLITSRTYSQ